MRSVSPSRATEPPSASITAFAATELKSRSSSPEHDRPGGGGDRGQLELAPAHRPRHVREAPVARGRDGERAQRPLHRRDVGLDRLAGARRRNPPVVARRELERVGLEERGLVAAALDPGEHAELVEELRELVGGLVDHADEARRPLVEPVAAQERLREAGDGRERRAQVVARERDGRGEVVVRHRRRGVTLPGRRREALLQRRDRGHQPLGRDVGRLPPRERGEVVELERRAVRDLERPESREPVGSRRPRPGRAARRPAARSSRRRCAAVPRASSAGPSPAASPRGTSRRCRRRGTARPGSRTRPGPGSRGRPGSTRTSGAPSRAAGRRARASP